MAELLWQAARKEALDLGRGRSPLSFEDLEDLAFALEADVFYRPLEPDISGFIVKEAGHPAEIFINSTNHSNRQKFTLAHEIGHLVDRMRIAGDDEYSFTDFRGAKYNLHEFFADEFAGALLMPEKDLEAALKEKTELQAARHFGVSLDALRHRCHRIEKHRS